MTIPAIHPHIPTLQPAQFGAGMGDAVANLIGKVDSSKVLELATTDILGMGIPRTAIEQVKRGPDAAREEAIRNFSATFTNVFLAGLYSYVFIKLFGKTNIYNPKRIPPEAFINAESLSAFGRMTEDVLANPKIKNIKQARQAFYRRALLSLQSADHVIGATDFTRASAEAGLKGKQAVTYSAGLGDAPLEKLVQQYGLDDAGRAALTDSMEVKPSWLERLRLKKPARNVSKLFYEGVIEPEARLAGLTEKVNLIDEKTATSVMTRNRRQLIKEIGYYGEHFLSKAFEGVNDKSKGWKEKVVDTLTRPSTSKLLPKAKDGLIPYALKSKLMYTKWPIVFTVVTSVSVAFFNNWLTRRKHGGVNFFPGEGGPAGKSGSAPQMAAPTFPAGSLTYRPNVFSQFSRTGGAWQ